MLDPVSAISLFAAATQLANYTIHGIDRLIRTPEALRSASSEINNLLSEIEGFLAILRLINTQDLPASHAACLKNSITTCTRAALSLQHLLGPLISSGAENKYLKLKNAISFRRSTKKIDQLLNEVQRHQSQLLTQLTIFVFDASRSNWEPEHARVAQASACEGLFMVKQPRNTAFLGQQSTLNAISYKISFAPPLRKIAIVGLEGTGKTQTALELVYQLRERSPTTSVYWVTASSQSLFEQSFTRILHIHHNQHASARATTKDTKRWLESPSSGPWIVVYDALDLETFGDDTVFLDALPDAGEGTILITSRNLHTAHTIASVDDVIHLPSLSHTVAQTLFESHLGHRYHNHQCVAQLMALLQYNPEALSRCASYMRANHLSLDDYLDMSLQGRMDTGFEGTYRSDHFDAMTSLLLPMPYNHTQQNSCAQLLWLLACMGETGIPLSLASTFLAKDGVSSNLNVLAYYSIVKQDHSRDHVVLHPNIRNFIRSYGRTRYHLWSQLNTAFTLVTVSFPGDVNTRVNLVSASFYLPHALSVWGAFEAISSYEPPLPVESTLLQKSASHISRYLRTIGHYADARTFAERALFASVQAHGSDSLSSMACLCDIVAIDQCLGRLDDAIAATGSLLDHQETMLHSYAGQEVVSILNEIALLRQAQGHYAEAESFHYRAISVSEQLWSASHVETLDIVHNLSWTCFCQQRYNEALMIQRQVVEGMEQAYGSEHVKTSAAHSNLANMLQHEGDKDESLNLSMRTLATREVLFGPDHPEIINSKVNLAQHFRHIGDLGRAKGFTLEALDYYQQHLGRNHPTTLICLGNLSIILQCQGFYGEGTTIAKEVVKQRRIKLGLEHPDTVMSMYDLSVLYQCQCKYGEAVHLGREVLEIRRRNLPETHLDRIASETHVLQLEEDYNEWLFT